MQKRFFHNIKVDFLIRSALIVFVAIVVIVSYNYFAAREAAVQSAKSNIQKLNSLFIVNAVNFVNSSKNIPQTASALFPSVSPTEEELTTINRYLFNMLEESAICSSAMFILNNGYFVTLDEVHDPKNTAQTDGIEGVRFILRIVDDRPPLHTDKIYYYGKDKKLISEKQNSHDPFDYKKYKWYERALQQNMVSWSNIHLLHRSHQAGLTISSPIRDKENKIVGAIAADILVKEFSAFINETRFTDQTYAYIIDADDKIVANSHMTETISVKDNGLTISSADDLNDPVLSAALEYWKKTPYKTNNILTGNIYNLSVNDVPYIACFTEFPKKLGLNWRVVSLTPTSIFSEVLFSIQKNSLYLAIFILCFVLVISYFQAQKFSEPISELVLETKRIKELDLEETIFSNSNIQELNELRTAVEEMKTNLRNMSKYIPKALYKKFTTSGQEVHLGGETQEITILFSDVADFTSLSENIKPMDLMLHLSDYFEELTNIILAEHGTIDKFIGDSIMSFWGAPAQDSNHAIKACHAALMCQHKLKSLNKFWVSIKKLPLVTRIGINTGNAVVGNVGSSERMNYTAIGDSVNTASRLEGLNKFYGTTIIISEAVRLKLPPDYIVRPLDVVAVKGKLESLKIFELVGICNDDRLPPVSPEHLKFCTLFDQGMGLYLNKDFTQAHQFFQDLKSDNLNVYKIEDRMVDEYINRTAGLIKSPPSETWDGVTHLTQK